MALPNTHQDREQANFVDVNGAVARRIKNVANLLGVVEHDYIALTYVTVGNGIGEIETVIYKTGGSGGTTVGTLTLAYDANDKLSTVTRS